MTSTSSPSVHAIIIDEPAIGYQPSPEATERLRKILEDSKSLPLLDPNPAPHDFKACPLCPHPPRPGEVRYAGN